MKSTILFLFAFVLTLSGFAQAPQKFNYQAVVRNNTGVIVTNQNIAVKAEILDSNSTTILYSETHSVSTNAQGLFALQVGGGSVKSGVFANIDWSAGNRYIRTSVDLAGGTNFQLIGTSQLLSVPYALQAKNIPISRVGNSDSIYLGDKLLLIPGVKVLSTVPDVNAGLVAWYPFNGNANDSSGYGNHGIVNGATLTTDRFGNKDQAFNFNGVNNYVQITNPKFLPQGNSSRTTSSWVYLNPTIGYNDWYSILSYGNAFGYGFLNDVLISSTFTDFACHEFFSKSTQQSDLSNRWHNLVITYDSSSILSVKMYLDGNFLQTNTTNYYGITSLNTQLTNLLIGKSNIMYTSNYFFNGKLDDIRIYNRALSQEEITYLATH